MSILLKATGEIIKLTGSLSTDELKKLIKADYFDLVRARGRKKLFVDDEGLLNGKPINLLATKLYVNGDYSPIVGDAVLLHLSEIN